MISFSPTILEDQPQIARWSAADPYHCDKAIIAGPGWWAMGSSDALAAFCVEDEGGPTMYVRLDQEESLLRVHIQFAPENEVDKKRVIKTILQGLPVFSSFAKNRNMTGLISESTSPSLIEFMKKIGFELLENTNDYVFKFEGN